MCIYLVPAVNKALGQAQFLYLGDSFKLFFLQDLLEVSDFSFQNRKTSSAPEEGRAIAAPIPWFYQSGLARQISA